MSRLVATCTAGLMVLYSAASWGATIALESVTALTGSSEVTVGWSFTNSSENVTEIFFDVEFDQSLVDPQVTVSEVFPGVFLPMPNGCLTGVGGIANTACILINPSTIRLTLDNSPNVLPNFDTGTITFDLDNSLVDGDLVSLELRIEGLIPVNAQVDLIEGVINVQDAPPSAIEVSPATIDFGSVFTGSISSEVPVEICNSGAPDALDLNITQLILSPSQFIAGAGGDCASVPFSLSQGQCCVFHVAFSPDSDQSFSGSLVVFSDAGIVDSDSVALQGAGVAPPTQLVFVESPDYAVIDGSFFGGVVVHVLDSNGNLFSDDSSTVVEMSLSADPSGFATLSGTTSVTVSGGVAVFPDLSIDQLGNGYVLRASDQADTLDAGDSEAFAVLPLELLQDRFEQD